MKITIISKSLAKAKKIATQGLCFMGLCFANHYSLHAETSLPFEMNETNKEQILAKWYVPFTWQYSAYNEPDWLNPGDGLILYKKAARAWENCGLAIEFIGATSNPVLRQDKLNTFGWAKLPPKYRALTFRKMKFQSDQIQESDIVTNIQNKDIRQNERLLLKVITHEFGHALGLLHSIDCNDVMSSAQDCGSRIAQLPPLLPTENDLEQCHLRYR